MHSPSSSLVLELETVGKESQHEDLPVAEDLHLAEDPQCEDLGQKVRAALASIIDLTPSDV